MSGEAIQAFNDTKKFISERGTLNDAADALSRITCASVQSDALKELHNSLCHPGVTRLNHFVRSRNLLYSIDEIRKVCADCKACAECKPQFFRTPEMKLIKATKPFERLLRDPFRRRPLTLIS